MGARAHQDYNIPIAGDPFPDQLLDACRNGLPFPVMTAIQRHQAGLLQGIAQAFTRRLGAGGLRFDQGPQLHPTPGLRFVGSVGLESRQQLLQLRLQEYFVHKI